VINFDNQCIKNLLRSIIYNEFLCYYIWVREVPFISSFCVAISDFIYHYLWTILYVFIISVVIVKNNLKNKIIHVLSLSNNLCTKFFL
jgi:type II secretory pathway component PulF